MNILFLMDPVESINPKKDSTYLLIKESLKRGHLSYYLSKENLSIDNNSLIFKCNKITIDKDSRKLVKGKSQFIKEKDVSCIWIRTDPPFNEKYLENMWFLDQVNQKIPIFNSPYGIKTVNEKIWATQFTKHTPKTLITPDKELYLKFLNKHKIVILKPLNGFGGSGIFKIEKNDSNKMVAFETLTLNQTQPIIIQAFIPAVKEGDKRIILLNGEPIGSILRCQDNPEEHRNNMFAGGIARKSTITESDRLIIETLKPKLKSLGLYFVGIDIIGDYLIEVNVTSPTGLQEINNLNNEKTEGKIIDFMENKIDEHHSK